MRWAIAGMGIGPTCPHRRASISATTRASVSASSWLIGPLARTGPWLVWMMRQCGSLMVALLGVDLGGTGLRPDAERSQNRCGGCPCIKKGSCDGVAGLALDVFDKQRVKPFEDAEKKPVILAERTGESLKIWR